MSAIQEAALQGTYLYGRRQSFYDTLNYIHNKLVMKMRNEASEKIEKAAIIQNVLSEIKKYEKSLKLASSSSGVVTYIDQEYRDLISDTFTILNEERANRGFRPLQNSQILFYRANKDIKSIQDDITEDSLAAFMMAFERRYTEQGEHTWTVHATGKQGADVEAVKEGISDTLQNAISRAINDTAESYGKNLRQYEIQTNKSQKIDVKGLQSEITFTKDVSQDIQKLGEALSGVSFSLKNYTTHNLEINPQDINLKLGDTNLYKAITGVLSDFYPSTQDQTAIFFRGFQIMQGYCSKDSRYPSSDPHAKADDVITHFSHMRFVYELRGQGLLDQNNNSGVVDFLIWNDPSSEYIEVRSTAELILNEFSSNRRNGILFNSMVSLRLT